MNIGSTLGEKMSRFFNPSTQVENDNRKEQIKNTLLFVIGTGLIVYFRKSLEGSLAKIAESA